MINGEEIASFTFGDTVNPSQVILHKQDADEPDEIVLIGVLCYEYVVKDCFQSINQLFYSLDIMY
jgi:hypothetical protein